MSPLPAQSQINEKEQQKHKRDKTPVNISAFKRAQQRYRRQGADPNQIHGWNDFLDFRNAENDDRIVPIRVMSHQDKDVCPEWHKDAYQGCLYGVRDVPGFLYAPGGLSSLQQSELAFCSVTEFCEMPHATNIDNIPIKPNELANNSKGQSMWELYKAEVIKSEIKSSKTRMTIKKPTYYKSFQKLAWSTMGWHYDWTARAYHEGIQSPMPSVLEDFSKPFALASLLLQREQNSKSTTTHKDALQFSPTAAIVNYYTLKSTMGGHQDDLEFALDKPVVSMSVGLAGVFLLGGGPSSHDTPVLPILVRSGDVMLLGGEARLQHHGMARVLPPHGVPLRQHSGKRTAFDDSPDMSHIPENDRLYLETFLSQHRININVRQVLPDGVESIAEAQEQRAHAHTFHSLSG